MGLDSVELVLATEEEFGIHIDDADAATITTPRMLADYVASRLRNIGAADGRCLAQAGFYRLRAELVGQFGAKRKDIRLNSDIRLFLSGDIRKRWEKLGRVINSSKLPRLECKKSLEYLLMLGMPLAGVFLLFLVRAFLLSIFALWIAAAIIIEKLANIVPEHLTTVGALIPYVRISKREEWTYDYILQKVIQITSAQIGVPLEKIQPDHRFVKDLGMD